MIFVNFFRQMVLNFGLFKDIVIKFRIKKSYNIKTKRYNNKS